MVRQSLRLIGIALVLSCALAPNLTAGQKATVSGYQDAKTSRFQCTIDCGDGTNGGTITTPDADSCLRACEGACKVKQCEFAT